MDCVGDAGVAVIAAALRSNTGLETLHLDRCSTYLGIDSDDDMPYFEDAGDA